MIYPIPNRPENLSGSGNQARFHSHFLHLHFDVRAPSRVAHDRLALFVSAHADQLMWTDFERPTIDDIRRLFQWPKHSSALTVEKLCDPVRSGAPLAHLSARKIFAPPSSSAASSLWKLFEEGVSAMDEAALGGYVELEDISGRNILKPGENPAGLRGVLPALPLEPIRLVPLDSASVNREFRTTEIHITFEHLEKVGFDVLDALLDVGFYTAFLRQNDGSLKLILTIQGFDPDVAMLYGLLHGWLRRCIDTSHIRSTVTLKKEDILGYAVLGNPSESGVQKVIEPLSVVEGWSERFSNVFGMRRP